MNVTAKAAVLALIALMSFQGTITAAHAEDRNGDKQVENSGHDDNDDAGRKKPRFQTKFFSD